MKRTHSYQKKVYEVMEEIAKELDIPVEVVDKIVHSSFTAIKTIMSNAEIGKPETFKTIKLTDILTVRPTKKYIKDYWKMRWARIHQSNYNKRGRKKREQPTEDREGQGNT